MDIGLIKNAEQSDIKEIIGLARKFHAVSGYEKIEFDDETVENILSASIDQGLCPIGVVEGKIVGFLAGLCSPAILNANVMVGTEIAWWVEPEYRGKRIAVQLLLQAEENARVKGLYFWSMMCLEKLNADGLENIYERLGYEKAERTYLRIL
jgi:GNAT superfamily N-acetyltransferase